MKLKTVFAVFNLIVVFSFLFVFLMPGFFLGWEYAALFWQGNWYLAALFFLILGGLNVYFWLNWRLFGALERENWAAVSTILEQRLGNRLLFGNGGVRLLVNAYLVQGKPDAVADLLQRLRSERPNLIRKNNLLLVMPVVLSGNGAGIVAYFDEYSDADGGGVRAGWPQWYRAFGLMLDRRTDEARIALAALLRRTIPPLVEALALYLLYLLRDQPVADPGALLSAAEVATRRESFTARVDAAHWTHHIEQARSEIHVLVLSKLLQDVTAWLYTS